MLTFCSNASSFFIFKKTTNFPHSKAFSSLSQLYHHQSAPLILERRFISPRVSCSANDLPSLLHGSVKVLSTKSPPERMSDINLPFFSDVSSDKILLALFVSNIWLPLVILLRFVQTKPGHNVNSILNALILLVFLTDAILVVAFNNAVTMENDPSDRGSWKWSKEWRSPVDSRLLLSRFSTFHKNCLVTVTQHSRTNDGDPWVVLRFNQIPQSIAKQNKLSVLAFEYLKHTFALIVAIEYGIRHDTNHHYLFGFPTSSIPPVKDEDANWLCLGYGFGSFPEFLSQHFAIFSCVSIEADQAVIDASNNVFGKCVGSTEHEVICDDAFKRVAEWVYSGAKSFKVVYLDCFDGNNNSPQSLTSRKFAENLYAIMSDKSFLFINIHCDDRKKITDFPITDSMKEFAQVFSGALISNCRFQGNAIMILNKGMSLDSVARTLTNPALFSDIDQLGSQLEIPFCISKRIMQPLCLLSG